MVMLDGLKHQRVFAAPWLQDRGDSFINLNKYLIANKLGALDDGSKDPRPIYKIHLWDAAESTPDGIKNILTIGASQKQ